MRVVHLIHDLALSLILGGIAGAALCAGILFDRAPSREIAGNIGSAIFGLLGPAVLGLSLIVLATHLFMLRKGERTPRRGATYLILGMGSIALLVALWITPRMAAIWSQAPHAEDGSGLVGEDRGRFFMLHGLTNLGYLSIVGMAAILVAMRSRRRWEEAARPHRGE